MPSLPVVFREGAGQFVFNVDYFDYAAGAGYKKYYFLGTEDSVGKKYVLTTDSGAIADSTNLLKYGNLDIDFDLTFNNPITIANALATISYTVDMNGSNDSTYRVTWTVYHYDGSTETSLGSVIDHTSSDGDPVKYVRRTVQVTLTEKHFKRGEILRVNMVTLEGGTGSTAIGVNIDPKGTITRTSDTGGTINSSSEINLPFKIQP